MSEDPSAPGRPATRTSLLSLRGWWRCSALLGLSAIVAALLLGVAAPEPSIVAIVVLGTIALGSLFANSILRYAVRAERSRSRYRAGDWSAGGFAGPLPGFALREQESGEYQYSSIVFNRVLPAGIGLHATGIEIWDHVVPDRVTRVPWSDVVRVSAGYRLDAFPGPALLIHHRLDGAERVFAVTLTPGLGWTSAPLEDLEAVQPFADRAEALRVAHETAT